MCREKANDLDQSSNIPKSDHVNIHLIFMAGLITPFNVTAIKRKSPKNSL